MRNSDQGDSGPLEKVKAVATRASPRASQVGAVANRSSREFWSPTADCAEKRVIGEMNVPTNPKEVRQ